MVSSTQGMTDNEHKKNDGRVRINVGGTVFETTVSTLTRVDNTVLSTMVAGRWQNQEELFVDRDPTYFARILNYLRDGENVTLPTISEAREALRKEAEFYNLPGLAKKCVPYAPTCEVDSGPVVETINTGDLVQWRESVIEQYWKYLVRYLHKCEYYPNRSARCMACGSLKSSYVGPTVTVHDGNEIRINYEDWTLLRDHMRFMKGKVIGVHLSCCVVLWRRELWTHLPRSALRLAHSK